MTLSTAPTSCVTGRSSTRDAFDPVGRSASWFKRVIGDRAKRAMSWPLGRSGIVWRSSRSICWCTSRALRKAAPSCPATWGTRFGPRRATITTRTMTSFVRLRSSTPTDCIVARQRFSVSGAVYAGVPLTHPPLSVADLIW